MLLPISLTINAIVFAIIFFVYVNYRFLTKRLYGLNFEALTELLQLFVRRGYHNDVLVLESDANSEKFCQFRKFIQDECCYGLDLVIPLIGEFSHKKEEIVDFCRIAGSSCRVVPTQEGWEFVHCQIADNDNVDRNFLEGMLRLLGFREDETLSATESSSFKPFRRKRIDGRILPEKGSKGRYDLFQPKE